MDTQVKERLTGAAILVALVVLLVPELLTGPPQRAPAEADAGGAEAPLRSYTIQLTDSPRAQRTAQPRTPATVAPAESAPMEQPPAPSPQEDASAMPEEAEEGAPAKLAAAPAVEPAEAPAASAPTPKEPDRPAPAKREAAPATGWSIQVGSFASRANADRLAERLEGKGFASFVTRGSSSGRNVFRVRVGPVADKAAAQALAAKLRSAGQSGSIVPHP